MGSVNDFLALFGTYVHFSQYMFTWMTVFYCQYGNYYWLAQVAAPKGRSLMDQIRALPTLNQQINCLLSSAMLLFFLVNTCDLTLSLSTVAVGLGRLPFNHFLFIVLMI